MNDPKVKTAGADGTPVSGLAFERLQENDLAKLEQMFRAIGGFKALQLIKDVGHIGVNGRLVKINYVTVQEGKLIFEPIKENENPQ